MSQKKQVIFTDTQSPTAAPRFFEMSRFEHLVNDHRLSISEKQNILFSPVKLFLSEIDINIISLN